MDAEMDAEMVLLVYLVGIVAGVYPLYLFLFGGEQIER